MIAAIRGSLVVSRDALRALLVSEHSEQLQDRTLTLTPEQTYPNAKTLPDVTIADVSDGKSSIVTFMNSLTYRRVVLVSVLVNSPNIIVSWLQFTVPYIQKLNTASGKSSSMRTEIVLCRSVHNREKDFTGFRLV